MAKPSISQNWEKKPLPTTLKSPFNLSNCVEIIFAFEGVNYIWVLLSFHMFTNVQTLLGVIYITASLCDKTLWNVFEENVNLFWVQNMVSKELFITFANKKLRKTHWFASALVRLPIPHPPLVPHFAQLDTLEVLLCYVAT
jgi:hypothetical protein